LGFQQQILLPGVKRIKRGGDYFSEGAITFAESMLLLFVESMLLLFVESMLIVFVESMLIVFVESQ
jgi:hypothetical protein